MIDPQQHKVTVTGNVDAHTLIKKLLKIKKRAELWPQISDQKDKHSTKPNNNKKQNMTKDTNLQDEQHVPENSDDDQSPEADEEGCEGDEIFHLVGGGSGGGGGGGGSKKKKKKKKGQNGNLTNGEGENGGYAPAGTGSDPLAAAGNPHMWRMIGALQVSKVMHTSQATMELRCMDRVTMRRILVLALRAMTMQFMITCRWGLLLIHCLPWLIQSRCAVMKLVHGR